MGDAVQDICSMALERWGSESQTRMAIEEMAELTKELCKYLRGCGNAVSIAEEIADVEIILEQMKLLYRCQPFVDEWKVKKLERLQEMLAAESE